MSGPTPEGDDRRRLNFRRGESYRNFEIGVSGVGAAQVIGFKLSMGVRTGQLPVWVVYLVG
jgi:hypothetical protein